jgi:hypothetical protein
MASSRAKYPAVVVAGGLKNGNCLLLAITDRQTGSASQVAPSWSAEPVAQFASEDVYLPLTRPFRWAGTQHTPPERNISTRLSHGT